MISKVSLGMIAMAMGTGAFGQISGPVPLAWRWQAPSKGSTLSTPAIDGDWIYQNSGGRIYCLDRTTGTQKWKFPNVEAIPGNFRTGLILNKGLVIAVADTKIIYAVDQNTGETKWTHPLSDPVIGRPIIAGRYLVYQVPGSRLMAIDAATGEIGWDAPYNVFDGLSGGIAGYQNSIIFFNNNNQVVSINLDSKKTNFRQSLSVITPGSTPAVLGDQVIINAGTYLISLNAATGSGRWQKILPFQLQYSPAVSSTSIYVASLEGSVMAFDLGGNPLMKKPIVIGSNISATPLVVGNRAIVPSTAGSFLLVDPTAGILWDYTIRPNSDYKVSTSTSSSGAPGGNGFGGGGIGGGGAPGGGGGNSGDTTTPPTVAPSATPAMAGDTLLVPVRDGSLLAFDRALGVDLTAPRVTMRFPNPGDQVSGQPPLQLWFKIEDDATGIKSDTLNVEIDGQKMDTKLEKDGTVIIKFSTSGKNRPLGDGRKTITVTVSDWIGNVRKAEFFLMIDNSLPGVKLPGSKNQNQNGPGGPGRGGGGLGGGAGGG